MSKVAMQFVRVSVEITGKHVLPFAVYRQCNNIPAAITYDDQPGGKCPHGFALEGTSFNPLSAWISANPARSLRDV
jgi:hypothetical protein